MIAATMMPGAGAAAAAGTADVQRLRIVHVLAPASFGGLEQVVLSLAGAQQARGHDVHVALILEPETAEHPLLEALRVRGVPGYALVLPPRAYAQERRMVRGLCLNLQPDVVHTHGSRCDVLHGGVAGTAGARSVSTSHGFTGGDWKNRVYEYLQQRRFRSCDAVIAVSRPMHEQLVRFGVPTERLHCVPNAWGGGVSFLSRDEARSALAIAPDAFCVGFIGRLTAEKGPDIFVEAVALAGAPVTALMIGDGAMRSELEQRAIAVRFAGTVASAARCIRAFDAVVLSSRTEGTPVVLLEAMAAQVPVIAAAVGGIPHVVDEREALLVQPENPAALAAAMRSVLLDPGAATRRAFNAAQRLEAECGAEKWLDEYDRVYRACGAFAAGSRGSR